MVLFHARSAALYGDGKMGEGERAKPDDEQMIDILANAMDKALDGYPAAVVVAALGVMVGRAALRSTKPDDLDETLDAVRWFAADEMRHTKHKPKATP